MSSTPAVIAVVAASGGLGASTLAVAVGRRLAASGPPSVVVDLDLTGGGLDVTAGVEHLPGQRWPAFAGVQGALPAESLLASLPHEDGCSILSAGGPGPRAVPASAVSDVLAALVAGSKGPVVLDVPARSPHLPAAVSAAHLVVVLVGLRTRALADADACVETVVDLADGSTDLRVVTRGPRPTAALLDDVEAHLGVAHLHHLEDDPAVVRTAERGLWPGVARDAVRRGADAALAALADSGGHVGRAS